MIYQKYIVLKLNVIYFYIKLKRNLEIPISITNLTKEYLIVKIN